jgi:hypothetical protein
MQKIQIAKAHVVVEFDQLKLAISGWVNELHEYAVPRKIMTIVPAAAISHRFGVLDGVAKCDLQVRCSGWPPVKHVAIPRRVPRRAFAPRMVGTALR